MRRVILVVLLALVASCAKPLEKAEIGDKVTGFHVRDAKTGQCLYLRQYFSSGKWDVFKVENRECTR